MLISIINLLIYTRQIESYNLTILSVPGGGVPVTQVHWGGNQPSRQPELQEVSSLCEDFLHQGQPQLSH